MFNIATEIYDSLSPNELSNIVDIAYYKGQILEEYIQQAAIKADISLLKYIHNPTENAQLTAIEKDLQLGLKYIIRQRPTNQVIYQAIMTNPLQTLHALDDIKISDILLLAAIKQNPAAILFIKKPPHKTLIIQAIKLSPHPNALLAQLINNGITIPTELHLQAVQIKPNYLLHIHNPTPAVIQAALAKNGALIRHVPNPTIDQLTTALIQCPYMLYSSQSIPELHNPSEALLQALQLAHPTYANKDIRTNPNV